MGYTHRGDIVYMFLTFNAPIFKVFPNGLVVQVGVVQKSLKMIKYLTTILYNKG